MADKWEPNQVFYDQLSKATLLKLLAEGCGNDAAETCQTMKRSDLAVTVNERLAGRRILPPALRPSAFPDSADTDSQPASRHWARASLPRSPPPCGAVAPRSDARRFVKECFISFLSLLS